MSTIAHPTSGAERVNLRAFLAGGGATTALIAAAVIAFLSIATFVAFNGLPFGGGDEGAGSVDIAVPAGAPEAAAAAAAATPGAVAATPAAATAIAPASPAGTTTDLVAGVPQTPPVTGGPTTIAPPGTPGAPRTGPGPVQAETGVLGGTVGSLESSAGNLGIDLPLGDLTGPVTGPLDEIVNGTVNTVGGLINQPKLGDNLGKTVNGVTGAVLGPGGVADNLLKR